jgi:hypothetical protein
MLPKIPAMQPSTVLGIAGAVGVAATAVAHLVLRDAPVAATIGAAVTSITAIFLKDDSAAARPIEVLVQDAVEAYVKHNISAKLPLLMQDAVAVAVTVEKPAAAAPAAPPTAAPAAAAPPAAPAA